MPNKNYTVYGHFNKINGLVYIGITRQKPAKRWLGGAGYKRTPRFKSAINKYGWGGFEHKILHEHVDKETACILERMYISFYKKRNMSYNIAEGGEGTESFSEEIRLKISKANKGKHRSEEFKKNLSKKMSGENHPMYGVHRYGEDAPMYGKHHTEESKRKISENRKGKNVGKSNPMYGKHFNLSEETKKKISESSKGKHSGKNNPTYGKGLNVRIDDDPIIYTAKEAADKYKMGISTIRYGLKKSNPGQVKSLKTKIKHIVYKV